MVQLAVSPKIKALTYYEAVDLARKINNKDQMEQATYDVGKKAKIGGIFQCNFSENNRAGNQRK